MALPRANDYVENGSAPYKTLKDKFQTLVDPIASVVDKIYDLKLTDFAGIDPTGATLSDSGLALATTAIRARMTMTETSANGTRLFIPRGYYKFSSTWDLQKISGLTIIGEGTQTDLNHNGATTLVYTGTGPRGIDCRSSSGLVFDGVQVSFNSATFSGILLDFSHLTPTDDDTSYCFFRNGNLKGIGTRGGPAGNGGTGNLLASCSRLIAFTGAIICGVSDTHFALAGRAIDGLMSADPLASYSNDIAVERCSFNWITQPAIMNPGQSWNIKNNAFEGFQSGLTIGGSPAPDSPAVGSDHGDTRSSGCVFSGNWCGDCAPDYWLDLWSAYGWQIAGNYITRIGATSLASMDNPYINMRLCGGISITGNEFYVETDPPNQVQPPLFDASSNVYAGESNEAVRGVIVSGNNIRSGAVPTNYTGLSDIAIFANDWPLSTTAPGNGYYLTDSSATVISAGGGGGGVTVQDEGSSLATTATGINFVGAGVTASGSGTTKTITISGTTVQPQNINALDYLTNTRQGSSSPNTLADINALKAAMDGKIVHFPPLTAPADYDFTLIGSTGFAPTKPTIMRGPGGGNDQVVGGVWVARLLFPAGVTAFKIIGNGSYGGASHSVMEDFYIKRVSPGGDADRFYEAFDGIDIQAGGFIARNVLVQHFGRDGYHFDTSDAMNANNTSLQSCHSYMNNRHGFFAAGTNSNALHVIAGDANANGNQSLTASQFTIGAGQTTLPLASGRGAKFPSSGRATINAGTANNAPIGFFTWTGKSGDTLTGVTWPAHLNGTVVATGSKVTFGFGMWEGGLGDRTPALNGGYANVWEDFHCAANYEGAIYENGQGFHLIGCYAEDMRFNSGFINTYRLVIGNEAHRGYISGVNWGGIPIVYLANDGTITKSPVQADHKTLWIRNPHLFMTDHNGVQDEYMSGLPVLTGSRGGNAALANLITMLQAQGRLIDDTTA